MENPNPMQNTSRSSLMARILWGLAAILGAMALVYHFRNWLHSGFVNWLAVFNMIGLFMLAMWGVIDLPKGKLRLILYVIAAGFILPSTLLLLLQ